MPDPMQWQRVKVVGADSKKGKQPSAVFRAKGPNGWFVAFEWGEGALQTLYVPDGTWDVELET
jgi:hypothetical protein